MIVIEAVAELGIVDVGDGSSEWPHNRVTEKPNMVVEGELPLSVGWITSTATRSTATVGMDKCGAKVYGTLEDGGV